MKFDPKVRDLQTLKKKSRSRSGKMPTINEKATWRDIMQVLLWVSSLLNLLDLKMAKEQWSGKTGRHSR